MVYRIIPLPIVKSISLRSALGWRDSVSFEVALVQIQKAVTQTNDAEVVPRLKRIIKYLSRNDLNDGQFRALRKALDGRPWVPVVGRLGKKGECTSAKYATLEETPLRGRFHLSDHDGDDAVIAFLQKMGCTMRPCLGILLSEIEQCDDPHSALPLLTEVAKYHNTPDLNGLIIFDSSGEKRTREEIYFADVETGLMSLEDELVNTSPAHDTISKELAEGLHLRFLSSVGFDEDDANDFQMGEDLVGQVRSVLRENDYHYAFNEWVTNADDAKSETFSVFFDPPRTSTTALSRLGHISADFASLQSLPHLILCSDSVFTGVDFRAIRDMIGHSTKLKDEDSHGRYGLGALSFYYFADVVTIISNDQVLILDPSGSYLPVFRGGAKRTSTLKPKEQFLKKWPGHVQRIRHLEELRGSQMGTVIMLPLHCTTEGPRTSGLSSTPIPLSTIYDLIHHHFHGAARDSLFFCRHLKTLDMYENLRLDWVVTAKRRREKSPPQKLSSVNVLDLTTKKKSQRWLIANSEPFPIPPDHLEVSDSLKLDSRTTTVALAIRIDSENEVILDGRTPPTFTSKIFSTTFIPGNSTHLPFHLYSVFATDSTRKSIIFCPPNSRGERDSKSAFNSWLVQDIVPPVYHSVLQYGFQNARRFPTFRLRPSSWFPNPHSKDTSADLCDSIAVAVVDHLPSSSSELLRSANKKWIPFTSALFPATGCPTSVMTLLNLIQLPNLCTAYRKTRIASLPTATRLTPAHVTKHLHEAQSLSSLTSLLVNDGADRPPPPLSPKDIQILAQYVGEESDLVGLPILITTSGTLLRVPSSSEPRVYITRDALLLRAVFPKDHFLLDGYDPTVITRLCEDSRTNVVACDEQHLANLICEELRKVRQPDESRQRHWIQELWNVLARLHSPPSLTHEAFQRDDLKIIDSTHGFLSPIDCKPTSVLRYEASTSPHMATCASDLGIPVLVPHSNPLFLELIAKRFPHTSVSLNLLEYFHSNSLVLSSETLPSDDSRKYIAKKLRSCLEFLKKTEYLSATWKWEHDLLDRCKDTFSSLSIWEAQSQGRVVLAPANRIRCFPEGIEVSHVSPFAANQTPFVAYSTTFAKLLQYCRDSYTHNDVCITAKELVAAIRLPRGAFTCDEELLQYKPLVRVILQRPELQSLQTKTHLPDENMHLRPPSELFDHTEQTFTDILRHAPGSYFVHESFHHFGPSLYELGICQGLSVNAFKFCVERIASMFASAAGDGETLKKVKEMSEFALDAYITRLPGILGIDSSPWVQLQDITFVKRKVRRREGAEIVGAEFCDSLDEILPPSKMVRREYQAVAWSQRGLFSREPSDNFRRANLDLWVPSVEEVVKHLEVLSRIVSRDIDSRSLGFRRALVNDLEATYQFLEDRDEAVKVPLTALSNSLCFLNVDDPIVEPWHESWYPAENLVFGLLPLSETQGKRRVKSFLAKYQKLLQAAGAHILDATSHIKFASEKPSESSSTHPVGSWIRVSNDMRLQGDHTDVVLLASDVPDGVDVNTALRAHKFFLAASSTHFRAMFSPTGWGSGTEDVLGPYFVIKSILDFLYTGDFEMPEERESVESLRNVLLLLRKSDEWGLENLKLHVQRRIIGDANNSMITRYSRKLTMIREYAEKARAELLKKAVEIFERRNSFLFDEEPDIQELEEDRAEIGGNPTNAEDDYQYEDEDFENDALRATDVDDFDFDAFDDVETPSPDDF